MYSENKEMWKIFPISSNQPKEIKIAIFIPDKINIKSNTVIKKKGHYIMTVGSIYQEDITIMTIYTPNIKVLKYINQMLTELKGEIDKNKLIVGDLNIPLSITN